MDIFSEEPDEEPDVPDEDLDEDVWQYLLYTLYGHPEKWCRTCDGDGALECSCMDENRVVAHCFSCRDEGFHICPDCDGRGWLYRG